MSLAERLFPASELAALQHYTYFEGAPIKRRRLNTSNRSQSASTAVDSGYSSDEAPSPKTRAVSAQASMSNSVEKLINTRTSSSRKRQRMNSEPTLSTSSVRPDLTKKYISQSHPADRRRYTTSEAHQSALSGPHSAGSPSESDYSDRDRKADTEIIHAQHAIALARQRLHSTSSSSGTSAKGPPHDRTDLGWTAGPQAASTASVFTRVFDGLRVNGNERNMLDLLTGLAPVESLPVAQTEIQLSAEERNEVEEQLSFAGLAMPVCVDEDELEYEPDTYHTQAGDDFDNFFMLDEASTLGKEGNP